MAASARGCAATAWYLAELADRSLEERHEAEPLYALLRRAGFDRLRVLDGGVDAWAERIDPSLPRY